ncbi:MAG: HEPN domain-containing protein [Thermoprotei archaeon]
MTKYDEYTHLARRSKEFLEIALYSIERGFYDLAAFSLEQALQLGLKACLLKLGVDYPRTYSIRKLLKLIIEVEKNPNVKQRISEILEKYAVEIGSLEDAYITARYIVREYSREEVDRLLKVVKEVLNLVGILGERSSQT